MLIDCFTFFNEFKMLDARLYYLNDVVDYFVICEADHTHAGEPKPLNLATVARNYPAAIAKKIIYVPHRMSQHLESFKKPEHFNPNSPQWKLENAQRNALQQGIAHLRPKDTDIIMFSDIDEIPSIQGIRDAFRRIGSGPVTFMQDFFWYNFNFKQKNPWPGTVMTSAMITGLNSPQFFRDSRQKFQKIENAGWHLSYFMTIDEIKTKLKSFAHQEYNNDKFLSDSYIKNHIRDGIELFDRPGNELIPASEKEIPRCIVEILGLENTILYRNLNKTGSDVDITVGKSKAFGSISVIVPTMWKSDTFDTMLGRVLDNKHVNEVILIDNDPKKCTKLFQQKLCHHKKLVYLPQTENLYVNQSWNLGVKTAKRQKLCFLSDDITFNTDIFAHIADYIVEENGVMGLNPSEVKLESTLGPFEELKGTRLVDMEDMPVVPQYFACMFFLHKRNFRPVPPELRIYFGDSWLYTACKLSNKKSKWIMNFPFSTIHHTTSESTKEFLEIKKDEFAFSETLFFQKYENVDDFVLSISNKLKAKYNA